MSLSGAIRDLARTLHGEARIGSFADWLAVEILRDTLYLDVIGGFKHQDLESLVKLDDGVAEAWEHGETSAMDNEALADAAGVVGETVRRRRQEWREKYKIEVGIPRVFYDAMGILAAIGATDVNARAALAVALANNQTDETFELLPRRCGGLRRRARA